VLRNTVPTCRMLWQHIFTGAEAASDAGLCTFSRGTLRVVGVLGACCGGGAPGGGREGGGGP
jgi:hypothetical protein